MSLSVLVVERLGLQPGQELTPALLEQLQREAALQEALDRALNYLSFRPRSRQEVERYLRRKETAPDIIEGVLERLTQLKLVDDSTFAAFWVESRERFSPRGSRALQSELRARGVAPEIAAEAASATDDDERAIRAARKKALALTRGAAIDYATFRDRLGPFLLRRGFSYETARRAVQALWREMGPQATD